MEDFSPRDSLRALADEDLARRSQASGLVYPTLYIIIIVFTPYARDHLIIALTAGVAIISAALIRTWLIAKFTSVYALNPRAWMNGFAGLTLLLAAVWGAFCAHAVFDYQLQLTAMLALLCTAGISAGAITTLSIHRELIVFFLALLLLPATAVAMFLEPSHSYAISLMFITYCLFMFGVARRLNREYWTALQNRVLLDQRARELEASNQELESYSYTIAHDLRTPLRSIIGFSQLLLDDHQGRFNGSEKKDLERVIRAGKHMAQLIDDLLELSRITRGKLVRRETDLSEIAQELADQLGREDPERLVDVRIQPHLRAVCDDKLLRIALQNLISNAWKFTASRDKAEIIFNAKQDNHTMVYALCDNGVGFDMSYADKLFKPFSRLHSESEFEGTGIGLATVQRIIRRHGGQIWAQATPGEGTCIYFTLT